MGVKRCVLDVKMVQVAADAGVREAAVILALCLRRAPRLIA